MFHPIQMETWPRREHFQYYRNMLRCGYSVTVRLDVTAFRAMLDRQHLHFYPSLIWCVSRLIQETPEFRMGVDEYGNPGYFDVMHPVYTVFHPDDHTFSDLWSEYEETFSVFYRRILEDLRTYGDRKGIKARADMPRNFYCISCVPWLDFAGYSTTVSGGDPNLFPVITCGKYAETNGKLELPFSLNISHAAADGYHTAKFCNDLQDMLNSVQLSAD